MKYWKPKTYVGALLPPIPKYKSKKKTIEVMKSRENYLIEEYKRLLLEKNILEIDKENAEERKTGYIAMIVILIAVIGFMIYNNMTLTCEDLIN